ncbi:uncharacterized protein LY89DRAFT_741943 [Mollisia scopiformis]|uniref:Uncharacterized protein n=1 Tax=Mollisia scopiformis TaxID=149040 RepID=A0A132B896_MOLSC|nr:uncharacterized protein LY89DRAFT_741943 [Mollisia scopiformis]KUJ08591.1 hypothetical protein LY89DRAFT_741943 [Mollisia scopiformis]
MGFRRGGFPVSEVYKNSGREDLNLSKCTNIPWFWEPHLDLFPQWLWLSDDWIAADQVPEPPSLEWKTDSGQDAADDEVPSLQLAPWGGVPDFLPQPPAEGYMYNHNGPFVIISDPTYRGLSDAKLEIVPPGPFWIGVNVQDSRCMPLSAGVFVGFRRNGRPQKNPWWWECVYAKLDKRGRVFLHAYNYNYLGMPLTPLDNYRFRPKQRDVIWIASLATATRQQIQKYVTQGTQHWDDKGVLYHGHGWVRNELRAAFFLPPYRF